MRATNAAAQVSRFRTQKTGALLAYLAYHRSKTHSRETLISLLWPDCDDALGRNSLSAALSALRRDLDADIVVADRFNVSLNSAHFSTDVVEFEAALAAAEPLEGTARIEALSQAIELYQGRLLPDFYDDWIALEARRLEEAFFRALRRLIVALKKEGQSARAIEYAERGVSLDPAREEAQRDLVQLYAATGQLSAARRQYAELERQLGVLGTTPSATTRQVMDEIERRAQTVAPPKTTPAQSTQVVTETKAPIPPTSPVTKAAKTARLPNQLTRFFGRENEIERLVTMLQAPDMRLVTLTGPGGSGKTRLSLEAARRFADDFEGQVHFAALADLQDPALLAETILDALHGRETAAAPSATSSFDKIVESLSDGPTLLLLDNFEQLVAGGAALVRSLVEKLPDLRVLVTSRQRLGIHGEREFIILPLPTPRLSSGIAHTPVTLNQYESVQLFVNRAEAVRPDFALTEANATTIAQLCRRLDGIPLAIELAAARSRVLAPAQMLSRLENSLDLLATGHKDTELRHRSLRATMAWSYDLLPPELQDFWKKLGIFRGGWTIEAAESVCDEPFALDYLEQLQEASLVLVKENSDGEMRFRMLETVREYALEQLEATARLQLEARYASYFEELAANSVQKLYGAEQKETLIVLEREQDNFRAVLSWLLEHASIQALQLCTHLSPFWETRAYFSEGRSWIERALENTPSSPENLYWAAQARLRMGWLAFYETDFPASQQHLQIALEQFLALNHARGQVETRAGLAMNAAVAGHSEVMRALLAENQVIINGMAPAELTSALPTLSNVGLMLSFSGDWESSRSTSLQVTALARNSNSTLSLAKGLTNLATIENGEGNFTAARELLVQAIEVFEGLNEPFFGSYALWNLGNTAYGEGNTAEARQHYRASAELCRAAVIKMAIPFLLETFARVDNAEGNTERAAIILGTSAVLRQRSLSPAPAFVLPILEPTLASVQATLGAQKFQELHEIGSKLNWETAMSLALEEIALPEH